MRNSPPHDGRFGFSLVNLLFILVGLYLLVGRFLIDIRRRSGTHYAVTGERILIVARGFQDTATSLPLATLADITLELKPGNAGTIVFGRDTIPFWANGGFIGSRGQTAPRFELIPDARAVHELIRTAQRRTF
jgi:hypothetical protein